jgi:hypothetical protein
MKNSFARQIILFYYRMYSKMDQIDRSIRQSGRRGGGGSNAALTTLAKGAEYLFFVSSRSLKMREKYTN